MKALLKTLVASALAALAAMPLISHADQGLTRAQVRQQLVELEQAGYNPADTWDYPTTLQQAEQVVAANKAAAQSAYGSATDGSSQAGK